MVSRVLVCFLAGGWVAWWLSCWLCGWLGGWVAGWLGGWLSWLPFPLKYEPKISSVQGFSESHQAQMDMPGIIFGPDFGPKLGPLI